MVLKLFNFLLYVREFHLENPDIFKESLLNILLVLFHVRLVFFHHSLDLLDRLISVEDRFHYLIRVDVPDVFKSLGVLIQEVHPFHDTGVVALNLLSFLSRNLFQVSLSLHQLLRSLWLDGKVLFNVLHIILYFGCQRDLHVLGDSVENSSHQLLALSY